MDRRKQDASLHPPNKARGLGTEVDTGINEWHVFKRWDWVAVLLTKRHFFAVISQTKV